MKYDLQEIQKEIRRKTEEQTSIQEQLRLTDYEEIKERLDACINWLQEYPEQLRVCVSRQTHEEDEVGQLTLRLDENQKKIEEYEKKTKYFSECYDMEKALHYVEIPKEIPEDAGHIRSYLESDVKALDKDSVIRDLNKVYFENRGFLTDYHLMQNEFREKYISYGRFGGKVILKNLKPTDIEELEGFFGKSFHSQKSVTVSAEKFRQALETSRYKEITPECLLENFFEEPLLGRQEQKSLREQEKERIWEIFQRDYEETPAEVALEPLRSIVKDNGNQELAKWDRMLRLGAEIYNNLPYRSTKMYLAVFAAMLTGNPHAFDIGTADGNFLYQIIQMDLEIRGITVETSAIFPAYKRQKSYLLAGIMLDDVSNYAMMYQVQAVKKDGTYHKGMAGFLEEQHIVQVPLAVLTEWESLHCPRNEIYIVENPSIFAMLCGKEETDQKGKAYMCMNGQPRLAGLIALDLFAKSETRVYYAGDLDPEGVLIAQKLSQYYKGEFYYWHMEAADYDRCSSEEVISPKRLKILERVTDERLKPVAALIRKYRTAGYQEMLAEEML